MAEMVTERGLPVNDLSMGIPGVGEIHPGAHLCALYSGPVQRDHLLVPYLREGLRRGDQCVCLRAGDFSGEQMISVVAASLTSSADDVFPLLRVAVDMSWVPKEPDAKEMSFFEFAVTQILAERPALFLCLYDLQHFEVGMLVNALRIHSKVLLDGTVLDNPHSLTPCDDPQPMPDTVPRYPLVRSRSCSLDGGDQWLLLTGAEVRIAELVASGMTNRETAEELIVSPHTVDAHLKHMYLKLGIHSRVELTVLALQHGAPIA